MKTFTRTKGAQIVGQDDSVTDVFGIVVDFDEVRGTVTVSALRGLAAGWLFRLIDVPANDWAGLCAAFLSMLGYTVRAPVPEPGLLGKYIAAKGREVQSGD